MDRFDRYLKMALATALVLAFASVGDAHTRKGDKFLAEGAVAESHKDWDAALDAYEKAIAEDPADVAYQIAIKRVRFQAGQMHVNAGEKMRNAGEIDKALAEFQKAYAIDPSSDVAEQELKKTLAMIERNRERGAELTPKERTLTPAELAADQEKEKLARLMAPAVLKPLSAQPINLRMANQPAKVLYETVGKLAGINVVFDPDYASDPNARRNTSVDLNNSTLDDALDYLATMTHTFWKPLSANASSTSNIQCFTGFYGHCGYCLNKVEIRSADIPRGIVRFISAFKTVFYCHLVFVPLPESMAGCWMPTTRTESASLLSSCTEDIRRGIADSV